MEQKFCPKCKTAVSDNINFCPNCGYMMRQPEINVSVAKQIGVYLLSVLLPPLGLFPAIKYLRFGDANAKRAGVIAIVLTIIAIAVTVWLFMGFMEKANEIIKYQLSTPDLNY